MSTPKPPAEIRLLTLETTCDETAAAVVTGDLQVLASVVASQDRLHEQYGGVVPEIASRAHVERILPVIDETLRRAELKLEQLSAIAVANTPGLAGSLLVGVAAAKALAVATGLPLVAVDHLQAHVYACQIASGEQVFPCLGLIVSGGHTSLYHCRTPIDFELLGGTIDDAAGEAFDKVASMLGLGFPGGPAVSAAARAGDPQAIPLPRPLLDDRTRIAFSFSGLKTAVRYQLAKPGEKIVEPVPASLVHDLAASFQQSVIDCLIGKTELALAQTDLQTLCVGGGVAANHLLRESLEALANRKGLRLFVPPPALCTDNAVMGGLAVERLQAGLVEDLTLDIVPGLVRG